MTTARLNANGGGTPLLSIRGLSKFFDEVPVVDRVDLEMT